MSVELRALLQVLDELGGIDRLHLVHRLRHELHGDVVAPGLVLGRLVVVLGEVGDECLRAGRVDQVVPDHRPGAEEVVLAGGPGERGVEAEARDREGRGRIPNTA